MDGWLKTLVAAACLVVIAGGAWLAWEEISTANKDSNARVLREKEASADSTRNDSEAYTKCRDSLLSSALGEAKRLRDWCRQNNYISYDEQLKAEGITD